MRVAQEAAIARVTEGRWVACATRDDIGFGLKPGGELDVQTTLCHTVRQMTEAVAPVLLQVTNELRIG